jgi:hypothetical protein
MALELLPDGIDFNTTRGNVRPPKPEEEGIRDIPDVPDVPDDGIAQFEVPDWLKELSEQGIDERSRFLRQGTTIGEQSARQQRQVGEMGFLSGASASGFTEEAKRQIDLAGRKSLVDLDLAVRSEDEKAKRDALSQIQAIEFQNKRIRDQEKNAARAEKLAQEQRDWMERLARSAAGEGGLLGSTGGITDIIESMIGG